MVNYFKTKYRHVLITPGLGENQISHVSRLDSMNKGYRKGQRDLDLNCKYCDLTYISAIDLKHPNGSYCMSIHQE